MMVDSNRNQLLAAGVVEVAGNTRSTTLPTLTGEDGSIGDRCWPGAARGAGTTRPTNSARATRATATCGAASAADSVSAAARRAARAARTVPDVRAARDAPRARLRGSRSELVARPVVGLAGGSASPKGEARRECAAKTERSEGRGGRTTVGVGGRVLVRGAGQDRTDEWRFCKPLPYHLATAPKAALCSSVLQLSQEPGCHATGCVVGNPT
jgi:hypothetical protein